MRVGRVGRRERFCPLDDALSSTHCHRRIGIIVVAPVGGGRGP
jgi:hypothetical protein